MRKALSINKIISRLFISWILFISWSLYGDVLRVLSLNAEWFPGRRSEPSKLEEQIHLCQVQHLLVDINPDILLLQEVRGEEAVEELISVLPDFKIDVVSEFGGRQELVIASRLETKTAWFRHWEMHEVYFQPRGLAFALFRLPLSRIVEKSQNSPASDHGAMAGKPERDTQHRKQKDFQANAISDIRMSAPKGGLLLAVYTVHFKSNYLGDEELDEEEKEEQGLINAALREASARQLAEHAAWVRNQDWEQQLAGILAGGDFNTTYPRPLVRGEKTFDILQDNGLESFGLSGIDHFLAWGEASKGDISVLSSYRVSDHYPVLLEIKLPGERGWERQSPLKMLTDNADACILIDVNHAVSSELRLLPGVGPVLSARIIEYRPYSSKEDLRRVPGIGPKTLEGIRDFLIIRE